MQIGRFTLTNRRGLLTSLTDIPWEKYITKDDSINVSSVGFAVFRNAKTVIKNNMFFPRDINDIVMQSDPLNGLAKEIVSDKKRGGKKLYFLIRRDNVTVSLDAGFDSKRGYREFTAETPLKETVAAACERV